VVTLNEGIREISQLADEKNWGEDPATKIYYGMIEFAEAGDIWKHRDDHDYLRNIGIDPIHVEAAIAEELIDAILYALHAFKCIEFYDADWMFDYKMKKNRERARVYTDDYRSSEGRANGKE